MTFEIGQTLYHFQINRRTNEIIQSSSIIERIGRKYLYMNNRNKVNKETLIDEGWSSVQWFLNPEDFYNAKRLRESWDKFKKRN